jgi:RimJ/RimL family protein N-acetyltransferase
VRVRLRVPTAGDADAWAALFDDPAVMRHIGTGKVRDRQWYAAFVQRQQHLAGTTGLCLFSVLVDDGVVGFTGIQPWTNVWGPAGEPEVGWRLGRCFRGRGYATSAARVVLGLARERGVPHVVAMIQEANAASLAVARKLDLVEEAVLRSPSGTVVHQYGTTLTP